MADLTSTNVPRRVDRVLQAQVDGELVLMSPKEFAYFGTEGVGDPVWELIDGSRTFGEIVAALEQRYAAPPGVIVAQTAEFLESLRAAGLIDIG